MILGGRRRRRIEAVAVRRDAAPPHARASLAPPRHMACLHHPSMASVVSDCASTASESATACTHLDQVLLIRHPSSYYQTICAPLFLALGLLVFSAISDVYTIVCGPEHLAVLLVPPLLRLTTAMPCADNK